MTMRPEHWLYTVPLRLRSLFRRRRVEQELDEELQDHLDHKIRESLAEGLTPEQSRRAALRAMDGLTQRKEECRDARHVSFIENTLQDIRFSLRVLRKSPGFTAAAVLTLALAIGANTAVFGVLNALILRPLHVPRAESLWGIENGEDNANQSYPNYLDLRDRNRSFEALAAYTISQVGLDTDDNPSRGFVYETSGNYFEALGIRPYLGRFFRASDEHGPNSAPFIVLSYSYWRAHFQSDPAVVGRVVRLNKHPFTILGVAPPDFHGTLLFFSPDFYVPIVNHAQVDDVFSLNQRGARWINMTMGHLKAGVTPAQAVADLNSIGKDLEATYPKENSRPDFSLGRPSLYGNFLGRPIRAFVAGLMLLSGLILLAACANLGSLFAARAADRSREVALRLALGAGRSRILRTLFTEAVLISFAGGAIGLYGSVALLRWLSVWQPFPRFPVTVPVNPDVKVYAAALLLTLASGFLFGAVPVRQTLRTDPYDVVKSGTSGRVGRRVTAREVLVVVQIAICAVLVTASLVAVRGLGRALHADFGFEPSHALLIDTNLKMAGYSGDRVLEMQKRMIDAVQTIPGVESAGLVDSPPLLMGTVRTIVFTDQTTDLRPSNATAETYFFSISPDYFRAAGTALLAGRPLTWHDDQSTGRVAVINRDFATKLFGSIPNALGRFFKRRDGTRYQVVGVVENGKYLSLTEDRHLAMFFPIAQAPVTETWLVLRSNRDPQLLAPAVKIALRNLDAAMPFYLQTWNRELQGVQFPSRVATVSLGILGLMGAMLSLTGIFGMAAYSVSRRLRELGIRMALGARRKEVLQAGLGRAFQLLAVGSAAGLILGILASRVLAFLVYEATPRDPLVLAGVVLAMLLLGLLATWIPAHRALKVNPSNLLREQ